MELHLTLDADVWPDSRLTSRAGSPPEERSAESPGSGLSRPAHAVLVAEAGTPLREARAALADVVGASATEADGWTLAGLPLTSSAPLGTPPLVHGACLSRSSSHRPVSSPPGVTVVDLHVVAGSDAGSMHSLGLGRYVVGRSRDADITLTDEAVSRRHCLVEVTADRLLVTDLGSSNTTGVGAVTLSARAQPWDLGDALQVGGTQIHARLTPRTRVARRPNGDGTYAVNRRPAPQHLPAGQVCVEPTPPTASQTPRLHLLALAMPALFAVGLAVALRSPVYLAMGLLSPLMAAGQFISDRRSGRLSARAAAAAYDADLVDHENRLANALRAEADRRRTRAPDAAGTVAVARGSGERLWERALIPGGPLPVRLGSGRAESDVRVRAPDGHESSLPLDDVPICLDLAAGPIGISGDREGLLAVSRALVVQLATWHSPAELRIWVLGGAGAGPQDWGWVGLLPHARRPGTEMGHAPDRVATSADLGVLVALLQARTDGRAGPARAADQADRAVHVVFLDADASAGSDPGLSRLLRDGPSAGIHVVALGAALTHLPQDCSATLALASPGGNGSLTPRTSGTSGRAGTSGPSESPRTSGIDVLAENPGISGIAVLTTAEQPPLPVVVDRLAAAIAQSVAVALAPNADGTPGAESVPDDVRLRSVLGLTAESDHLAGRLASDWLARPAASRAVLGATARGAFALDLAVDGPHVLLGGTTGSGKSELLRTLITTLAVVNRPDRLAFVLIDYKGGSAFDRCAELPHVAGLVTDLDGEETGRALRALEREVHRREQILRASGSTDLEAHNASTATPLPRLVLVIDEYRALADDLPDFLHGLLRIASLGRSLGIHLVLATQRPNGIVSADIRANVNARIALRLRDVSDAYDVVDCADPASFSAGSPGRGVLRVGGGPPVTFQAAQVSTPSLAPGRRPAVRAFAVPSTHREAVRTSAHTIVRASDLRDVSDLDVLVTACREASRQLGVPPATPPWQPPLPSRLSADTPDLALCGTATDCAAAARPVTLGLVDDPDQLAQWQLRWDPSDAENLGVVGSARSGRTTTLTTLLIGLLATTCPSQAVVSVLAGGRQLAWVADLPHTSALVGPDEPARLRRVVARLATEVRRRRTEGPAGPAVDATVPPLLVLVVDDLDEVLRTLETLDQGRGLDELLEVLRSGPAVGVRGVLAGGRSLLAGPVAGTLTRRIVLGLTDPNDAMLAGLPPRSVSSQAPSSTVGPSPLGGSARLGDPPGRARLLPGGLSAQMAIVDSDDEAAAASGTRRLSTAASGTGRLSTAASGTRLLSTGADGESRKELSPHRVLSDAIRARHHACTPATRVAPPLPSHLGLEDLRSRRPTPEALPLLGLDEDGQPRGIDLAGRSLAVIGPPASGRTTALVSLALELERLGRPALLIRGRPTRTKSPDGARTYGGPVLDRLGVEELRLRLNERPDTTVLVDDLGGLDGLEIEELLLSHLHTCPETGGAVVVTAESTSFGAAFRGLAGAVRRGGHALAIMAGRPEEEALGLRLPRGEDALPGRACYIDFARNLVVQLPVPDRATPGRSPSDTTASSTLTTRQPSAS